MSQICYGICCFVLFNIVGYSLGIFLLENLLLIYGVNNLGKSVLINVLQFLIFVCLLDMSFGKYSMEQLWCFYFVLDISYIFFELMLFYGLYVIGVVGCGLGGGFGYQFFVYVGELSLDYYQKNGICLCQCELFVNFECEGIKVYEVKLEELCCLLVGGYMLILFDLIMILLCFISEQSLKIFCLLFINLLYMCEIIVVKFKQLFFDVFEYSLCLGNVDYIVVCEEVFCDVWWMEQDYQVLVVVGLLVEVLVNGVIQCDVLCGKMYCFLLLFDSLFGIWYDYVGVCCEELLIQYE